MSQQKALVVVFGASGETGRVIMESLLRSDAFRVAAVVRNPINPSLVAFAERGVTIHQADLLTVTQDRLTEILSGAETAIATLPPSCFEAQRKIADAAKAVGVKRFIPDDFATHTPAGVMKLQDDKLAIREYIVQSGVGHTFIEVGWWMQLVVPYPAHITGFIADSMTRDAIGSGDVPSAVTDLFHIGDYVLRIIQDERTLNRVVFIWEDEVTLNKVWALVERKLGKEFARTKKNVIPEAEFMKQLEALRAAGPEQLARRWVAEYRYSMYIRGDNTAARAKADGALDFKELYPDVNAPPLEDFMDRFYASPYVPYSDTGRYDSD
ncbi:hypothetical protein BD626DRAFT_545763 [Schizophyllum amplum]|uniref:NmrA-like domain-containing protein n=1 Tax=Schizophyllum amplum TaxID=97359 RepID=A0A550CP78_9AGAR|nr:hypothetical protein BD626DRAFT_545763 [Auriculariopsis ampla]